MMMATWVVLFGTLWYLDDDIRVGPGTVDILCNLTIAYTSYIG